jgi:hypothetical protein
VLCNCRCSGDVFPRSNSTPIYFFLIFPFLSFPFICFDSAVAVAEERNEQLEFETGPLSVLMQSVKQNTQVSQLRDPFTS